MGLWNLVRTVVRELGSSPLFVIVRRERSLRVESGQAYDLILKTVIGIKALIKRPPLFPRLKRELLPRTARAGIPALCS